MIDFIKQCQDDIRRAKLCLDTPEFSDYAKKLLDRKESIEREIVLFVKRCNLGNRDEVISKLIELQIALKSIYWLYDTVENDLLKEKVFKKDEGTE